MNTTLLVRCNIYICSCVRVYFRNLSSKVHYVECATFINIYIYNYNHTCACLHVANPVLWEHVSLNLAIMEAVKNLQWTVVVISFLQSAETTVFGPWPFLVRVQKHLPPQSRQVNDACLMFCNHTPVINPFPSPVVSFVWLSRVVLINYFFSLIQCFFGLHCCTWNNISSHY